jgi:hypothetical protein
MGYQAGNLNRGGAKDAEKRREGKNGWQKDWGKGAGSFGIEFSLICFGVGAVQLSFFTDGSLHEGK